MTHCALCPHSVYFWWAECTHCSTLSTQQCSLLSSKSSKHAVRHAEIETLKHTQVLRLFCHKSANPMPHWRGLWWLLSMLQSVWSGAVPRCQTRPIAIATGALTSSGSLQIALGMRALTLLHLLLKSFNIVVRHTCNILHQRAAWDLGLRFLGCTFSRAQ